MASKREIMKKLNERKKVLVEILNEYNKHYVEIANKLMKERYAGLGMRIVQSPSEDDPHYMYGCYSYLKNVEKTKHLVDVFQKRDLIEGHEDDRRLYFGSYDGLAYSISILFSKDIDRALHKMEELPDLISKFDACGFTPSEVLALGHLLFFEQVSLVPKAFEGHRPSYNTLLRSFLSVIVFLEFSIDFKSQPHKAFEGYAMLSLYDVDLEGLYGE